jgi:hypothetical protein
LIEPEADPDFPKSAGMLLFLALKRTPKNLRNKKKNPDKGKFANLCIKKLAVSANDLQ